MTDPDIAAIQRAYPQIYLACHVEHRGRASSPTGLTARDATLLAHVDAEGSSPARLARHLGVAPSTLSAAVARLADAQLLRVDSDPADARRRLIRLTEAGQAAIGEENVLDAGRLAALLARMTAADRRRAVDGLKLLAAAARAYREEER
jgi:DNA-binding MarR family transcriptional regulator